MIAAATRPIPTPIPAAVYQPQVVFGGEDDPGMCRLLAATAGRSGRHVVTCTDGEMLLARMARHVETHHVHPALVVSDHRMPGRTGLAVLETMRELGWLTPFVMTTAFPDDELVARVARFPATAVLGKPFPMSALARAIDRYLTDPFAVPRPASRAACASCGASTAVAASPRGATFCDNCEPTGRRDGRGFDALYVELGGES